MYGELAYGEKGKKSSANPDKCQALEGIYNHQVMHCTRRHIRPCQSERSFSVASCNGYDSLMSSKALCLIAIRRNDTLNWMSAFRA